MKMNRLIGFKALRSAIEPRHFGDSQLQSAIYSITCVDFCDTEMNFLKNKIYIKLYFQFILITINFSRTALHRTVIMCISI